MRIYVGNLSYRSSEQDVHKAFTVFGEVTRTQLAIDPATGRSAGFAYVEMPNEEEALTAIARLNGKEINSRVVSVSLAAAEEPAVRPERERSERPGRFGRDGADSRRHAPRHSDSRHSDSRSPSSGQRPRSGGPGRGSGRDNDGPRGAADRRPRSSQPSSRGNQFRGERPRGGNRPASVWEQRRSGEPPTTQRRDRDSSSRDQPKDQPSAGDTGAQQPANAPEPPAADNPWTRRRPKSP